MSKRITDFERLEALVREGESQILEFKPESDIEVKGSDNRILRGIVALANTRGGNLVIGVKEEKGVREISGVMRYDQDYISNWVSQLVYSFVDPPDLSLDVYSIESKDEKIKCIGILVPRSGIKYALRYSGRESKKPLTYYLLLRIGDSTREVDFTTFFSTAFNNLIEGLSSLPGQIPMREVAISPEVERKFDLEGAEWYLQELQKVLEPSITKKLVNEFRTKLTDLPYNHVTAWTGEIKGFVSSLLDFIKDRINDEQFQERCLDFLDIISNRCDDETSGEIRDQFLKTLDDLYGDPRVKKSHDLLSLLQRLRNYELKIMKKLLIDALDKWDDEEFDRLYSAIELYRCADEKGIMNLQSELVDIIAGSRKCGDIKRAERAEKFYDLVRRSR